MRNRKGTRQRTPTETGTTIPDPNAAEQGFATIRPVGGTTIARIYATISW
jgi:hypothetical protein